MTAEIPDGSPEAFRRRAQAYYLSCGEPSLRRMERASTSPKFAERYPGVFKDRKPVPVTRNVLWYWLSGKRQTLPDHALLTSFVLVCQWLGFESMALAEDKGADILEDWHQDLRRARAWTESQQHREGEADSAGDQEDVQEDQQERQGQLAPHPPLSAPPVLPAHPVLPARIEVAARPVQAPPPIAIPPPAPSSDPPGGSADFRHRPESERFTWAAPDDRQQQPLVLSPRQRASLDRYGPYGWALLEQATAGSAESAYQAGVLLSSSPDTTEIAFPFVLHAAICGHTQALELVLTSSDRIDPLDAAAHANELAEAAAARSQTAAALVWYECAARNGLPAAAMKLAMSHQARGNQELAITWLQVAAGYGDTRAETALAELTRRDRFPRAGTATGGARTPYN